MKASQNNKFQRLSNDLHSILDRKLPPNNLIDDKRQRIISTLQISNTREIDKLYNSTRAMIVERIQVKLYLKKVLEQTPQNQVKIERNLKKLTEVFHELDQQEQTMEIRFLKSKIENKIKQQTSKNDCPSKQTSQDLCQICFEKERQYVVVPCGHYIYCQKCKELIRDHCLLCR